MSDKFIPTKEQLIGLHRLLMFLCDADIEWTKIGVSGGKIVIKTEPPKGEIDIRIFKIDEDGRVDDDEFREQIQKFN